MSSMNVQNVGAPVSMSVSTGVKQKKQEAEQFSEESGTIKMPEVKVAHSEQEAIRNRIEGLREQIKQINEADDLDPETKRKLKEQITQQISDLNTQLLDVQNKENEKQQEKKSEKTDNSRRFDRYEPSEALQKANTAGIQNAIAAQTSVEQVKIHNKTVDNMNGRVDVLKNEIKLDIKSGASTKVREEEVADLKSKIRKAGSQLDKSLEDAKEKTEPTIITYDGGLAWLEELRQKKRDAADKAQEAAEDNSVSDTPAEENEIAENSGENISENVGENSAESSEIYRNGTVNGVQLAENDGVFKNVAITVSKTE